MTINRFLLVNRLLYIAVAIAIGGALAVPWLLGRAPQPAGTAVSVPVVRAEMPALDTISFPVRNPFDAGGEEWIPAERPVASAGPVAAGGSIRGVLRVGSVAGVFTEEGFVRVGDMLKEGRLEKVGAGEVVVSTPAGTRTLPLENGLRQRLETLRSGG
jgi:hypothetical protein